MTEIYALDLDWDFLMHLAKPDSWQAIRDEHISTELIEDDVVKSAYEFQLDHVRKHKKIATASVIEAEYAADSVAITEPQAAIGDLIDRMRQRYANNEGRAAVLDLTKVNITEPDALARGMIAKGRELHGLLATRGKSFSAEDYEKAIASYDRAVTAGKGASLGFRELDDYFYGQRGLTFLVGAPKSFKSWFTVKAVMENVKAGNFPYLYSLELPAEETDMRLRCLTAQVPYWKYLQHGLTMQDRQQLEEASELLKDWGRFIIDKPNQGDRDAHTLIERARDAGADCIFVDQLQYVENNRGIAIGALNDTKDYFQVINDFRDYSDDGPIWCVHQFNRSIMNSDKMPEMQQIKGSAAVEECATLALGLWASKTMRASNLVHIGTLTARNYGDKAWETQVLMKSTCGITLNGEVKEEEEE